jgi:hypothetical protein
LEKIYTALAFINLNKLNHTIIDYIPDTNEAAYILILSSDEKQEIEIISGGETTVVEVRENA